MSILNSEANARRIALVESCFGASGQPLAVPGRVLVGEGVLTKMCRKKPKPRQVFLFNDILVYGNIVMSKKKYNQQHIIPLEEVQLSSLDDNGQHRNGWLIKTPTKSFAVYAATATEKTEWMAHINKCVQDLLNKSGKKAADTHAAVWVPDDAATTCQHCQRVQFNVIQRRHHCRKCGRVVCGACSSKKILLPHQSSKPLRCCLACYDEVSAASKAGLGDNRPAGDARDMAVNDNSSDDDSDDEGNPGDDAAQPPMLTQTMKFYERGDAATNANAEVGAPAAPEDDAAVIDKLV
ncbi:pleckstrin homology domain-containing family F member 2 isoform X2 [Hyalella azteca]|uniref:Pleckstrin homology domain-containing family F member 2 isoform X2 n=1 Tax=Hyalella azteca TaxID=294128 RepID=A0A8B7P9Z0_HYAAZ|nr:pleckstrin homology domain-containing family F member 2 isoform X2 [Hyalella azteca]